MFRSHAQAEYAVREFWATIGPGGRWHPAAFIEHKGHLVMEAALLIDISALLLQHSYKPSSRKGDALTDRVWRRRQEEVLGGRKEG